MNSVAKLMMLLVPSLGVAGAVMTLGDTSSASVVPMAGIAQQPSQANCFANGNGRIFNNCSGVRQFCLGINMETAGSKTVEVTAYRPNGGTLTCHTKSINRYGGVVSAPAAATLNVVNVDTQFTVGTVYIVPYGSAYVCCDMSQGAVLDSVNLPP